MRFMATFLKPWVLCAAFLMTGAAAVHAQPVDGWRILNPPLPMPAADASGTVESDGANLHYFVFGADNEEPVILLHGGLGSSEDFGGQIPALAEHYKVIAIDTRGHGRSTDDDKPYDFLLFSSDVVNVMDGLGIDTAMVVGWSDGANTGFALGIHHPGRIKKLFALGGNSDPAAARPSVFNDALIGAFVGAAAARHAEISPRPDEFEAFSGKVFALWGGFTPFTADELASISVPVLVATGVYEEAIDENHTRMLANTIPGGELWLIDNASHFAQWQQVDAVNKGILDFLAGE